MKKLKAISLFSGAMGLDIGIERAGFDVRVCVDNYDPAVETIKNNTSIPVIDRDITLVTSAEILKTAGLKKGEVDLVFGGPPCQAFSTAGARRSLQDFRGNLVVRFLQMVADIRPRAFLLENVRGLLSSKLDFAPEGYEEYHDVVSTPGSVVYFLYKEFNKLGYKVSFSLFDSANYGVPQRRERVLMFGIKDRVPVDLPRPTHTEDGLATGKKWVTLREALAGLQEANMDYVKIRDTHKLFLRKLKAGQYWKHLPEADQKLAMGASYNLPGGKTGFYRRLSWDKPSPALVTSPVMPATMLCHPTRLRPLSVQEYARIQQFPDNWKFAGPTMDIYKQIGNAVPVGLGYAAGKALATRLNAQARAVTHKAASEPVQYSRYKCTDHLSFLENFAKQAKVAVPA